MSKYLTPKISVPFLLCNSFIFFWVGQGRLCQISRRLPHGARICGAILDEENLYRCLFYFMGIPFNELDSDPQHVKISISISIFDCAAHITYLRTLQSCRPYLVYFRLSVAKYCSKISAPCFCHLYRSRSWDTSRLL